MLRRNTVAVGLRRMVDANITKQDLRKTVERLTKEIVQCQNSMEAGRPCHGTPVDHAEWLGKLQADLTQAETELVTLEITTENL